MRRCFGPFVLVAQWAASGSLVALALGCGPADSVPPSDDGGSCATTPPKGCPTPEPSWKNDVQPIIVKYCNSACHGDGGVAQRGNDFTTYAGVYGRRTTIYTDVFNCKMPPAAYPQPSLAQREALLAWTLPCGAPQN
jgi:hypothetical protein